MQNLFNYLSLLPAGPILDTLFLEQALSICWHEFEGSEEGGMAGHKLHGRMEDVLWAPPVLTFTVERHGGIVLGSSRADLHKWVLNIDTRTARCEKVGYRQLHAMQPKLDIRPIAAEVVLLIINRQRDERLKWKKDGSVRIQIGKILPETTAQKQTLAARRKRFRNAVDALLSPAGWHRIQPNVYGADEN